MPEHRYAVLFQGEDDQWFFHIKRANGEIVLASEGYTRKDSAWEAIEREFPGIHVRTKPRVED